MATFEETFQKSTWALSSNPTVPAVARNFFNLGAASRDAEVARFHAALAKINDIRNSIIGYQNVNFSAHIYPLVAALNEAGFEGMGYEEASKLAQTQVELITDLRSQVTRWKKAVEGLTAGGSEYVDDPEACAAAIRQRMNVPKIVLDLRSKIEAAREAIRSGVLRARVCDTAKGPLDFIDKWADALEAALGKQGEGR